MSYVTLGKLDRRVVSEAVPLSELIKSPMKQVGVVPPSTSAHCSL